MNTLRNTLLCSIVLALSAAAAQAQTDTSVMTVTAEVVESCEVSSDALAFGQIDPLQNATTATDATATITVLCTNGGVYDVGLDAGLADGATVSTRAMENAGGATLAYGLYTDTERATNWGNTVDTDTVGGTGTGTDQLLTVYGRIPSGQQTAPIGVYSDSVTVTVTF